MRGVADGKDGVRQHQQQDQQEEQDERVVGQQYEPPWVSSAGPGVDDGQRPLDILLNAIANTAGYDLNGRTGAEEGAAEDHGHGSAEMNQSGGTHAGESEQINLAELLDGQSTFAQVSP